MKQTRRAHFFIPAKCSSIIYTQWLTDEYGSISVAAVLAVDSYNRTVDEVTLDLREAVEKMEGSYGNTGFPGPRIRED